MNMRTPPRRYSLRERLTRRSPSPDFIDRWAAATSRALDEPAFQRDPVLLAKMLPLMELWGRWFDAEVRGLEHVPDTPVLLVGNHSGGALTPDTAAVIAAWYRAFGLDRDLVGLAFDSAFSIPRFGDFMRRIGMVPARHAHAAEALEGGSSVIVYPGGTHEAFRPWRDRNRIDFADRKGFVKLALRQGVQVVPVVGHGGHESTVVLTRGEKIAAALRLDRIRLDIHPILFQVPWGITPPSFVGVPLPAKITVQVCPPLDWRHLGPDAADDPVLVQRCYDEVTEVMQRTLDTMAQENPFPLLARLKSLVGASPEPSRVSRGVASLAHTAAHAARLALDVPRMLPTAATSPAQLLRQRAEIAPHDLGLVDADGRRTWGEVDHEVDRWAAWFRRQGVVAGDNVALVLESRPALLFAMMALNRVGAAAALVHPGLTGEPLRHAMMASTPRLVLAGDETAAQVDAVAAGLPPVHRVPDGTPTPGCLELGDSFAPVADHQPRNDDTFAFVFTSGTTGLPKAAIVRNQKVVGGGCVFGRLMHQSRAGDVIYVPLPLFHSNPLCCGWGAALATGAAMALRRKLSVSAFWDDVHAFRATSFVYVGEVGRYLTGAPPHPRERDHRLRVAVGNGMAPDVWERFQERFAVPVVREFYGSTEGNAFLLNVEGRPGFIGRLAPGQVIVACDPATGAIIRNEKGRGRKVRAGEAGLLIGRLTPVIAFDGYVDRGATDDKILRDVLWKGDAWFDSGDLIRLHPGRWASFVDRMGQTYRWKGENVSTAEVAAVLRALPGVEDAVVYGVAVPHAEGRAGMCALRLTDGFALDDVLAASRGALGAHQRPQFVRLLDGGGHLTETFKHRVNVYREQGFDPSATSDRLFLVERGASVPLDPALYAEIAAGTVRVNG